MLRGNVLVKKMSYHTQCSTHSFLGPLPTRVVRPRASPALVRVPHILCLPLNHLNPKGISQLGNTGDRVKSSNFFFFIQDSHGRM